LPLQPAQSKPPAAGLFEEVWPSHENGIGRSFVDALTERDIDALGRILGRLIRVNEGSMQLEVDYHDLADRPVDDVRGMLDIPPKIARRNRGRLTWRV
jgi:hypothetical protein